MECNFSKDGAGIIDVESEPVTETLKEESKPINEITSGGQTFKNAADLAKAQAGQTDEIAALEAKLAEARAKLPPSPGVPAKIHSGAIAPGGIVLGDKIPDFKDIILPRLNLVHPVGQLKDQFIVGSIVFGQNVVLFTPPVVNPRTGNVETPASPPVNITVLGFRPTRFVEKVVGGAHGLIVDTEDQVRANGGTLSYKEWELKKSSGMRLFQEMAEALLAVERPESCNDDGTVFNYSVTDGDTIKKYALCLWAMKGTAYTAAAKRVFFTARAVGCLNAGYPTYNYSLTTRLEQFKSNSAWVPVCIPAAKSTPGFMEFARQVLNPPSA
jgi:hypothetical protein